MATQQTPNSSIFNIFVKRIPLAVMPIEKNAYIKKGQFKYALKSEMEYVKLSSRTT